jgi:hypothetical protein
VTSGRRSGLGFGLALLLSAGGCHSDLCDDLKQACLSVRLEPTDDATRTVQSDRLRVFVSTDGGPRSERLTTPAAQTAATLPIAFSLLLGERGGQVEVDVVGELGGMPTLRGQGRETVAAGEHRKLNIPMSLSDGSLPGETPAPRSAAGFAYFPDRRSVVLFGGQSMPGAFLDDTWEYDPTLSRWRRVRTTSAPSPRAAELTYDPRRRALVLFGGQTGAAQAASDTWVFGRDGSWSRLVLAPSPSPRGGAAIVYDTFRDAVQLHGGRDVSTGQPLSDTWELPPADADWRPRLLGAPPVVNTPRLVFDGRYTLLIGSDETAQTPIKVYRADASSWTELAPPTSIPPSRRSEVSAVYDRSVGTLLLFGGRLSGAPVAETYRFSPVTHEWTPVAPPAPPAQSQGLLEYVPELSGALLTFGLGIDGTPSSERWVLRDAGWQQLP